MWGDILSSSIGDYKEILTSSLYLLEAASRTCERLLACLIAA